VSDGSRRPFEVAIVVHRPSPAGPEYLVLLRSPDQHGYWHLVAGGVDWEEDGAAAAARELHEETGLVAVVHELRLALSYSLADEPEDLRRRFPAGTERVRVGAFRAEAAAGWEPALDAEHVDHRWLDVDAAVALLHYPEPRDAVLATHRSLEEGP
jgi:8-oxo-dGTP pyrophosphatase MutT (NUDIX family)